jgi:hypothetical protein
LGNLLRSIMATGAVPHEEIRKLSCNASTVPPTIGQGRLCPCLISEVTTGDLWLSFTPLSNYIAVGLSNHIITTQLKFILLHCERLEAHGESIDFRTSRHEHTSAHEAGVIVQLPKKYSASLVRPILNMFS